MKKVTEFLEVRSAMRSIYYYMQPLFLPKDKKKCLSIGNVEALFYINTPLDLVMVENPFLDEGAGGEKKLLQILLNNLNSGDVAYDIGANIGVHTILMAKKVGVNGYIVAVEPEIQNFESLKNNINLNHLKNVIQFQIALGNSFNEVLLYGKGAWGSIMSSKDSISQKVKIVPGDYLVLNEHLPTPKIIKIDVEGYEYYVIKGFEKTLKNDMCQMVCCEVHPNLLPSGITPDSVLTLLKSYGFNNIESYPRGDMVHVFCYKNL